MIEYAWVLACHAWTCDRKMVGAPVHAVENIQAAKHYLCADQAALCTNHWLGVAHHHFVATSAVIIRLLLSFCASLRPCSCLCTLCCNHVPRHASDYMLVVCST